MKDLKQRYFVSLVRNNFEVEAACLFLEKVGGFKLRVQYISSLCTLYDLKVTIFDLFWYVNVSFQTAEIVQYELLFTEIKQNLSLRKGFKDKMKPRTRAEI